MITTYSQARDIFLKFYHIEDTPSEIKGKFIGLKRLRTELWKRLESVLDIVGSDYDALQASDFVFSEFGRSLAVGVIEDILNTAFECDQHTYYKDILVYLTDSEATVLERQKQWNMLKQRIVRKEEAVKQIVENGFTKQVIREYNPQWEYSMYGSYGVYQKYKGKPEFNIMMSLLEHCTNKQSIEEDFKCLLLLKMVDIQLQKTEELMTFMGVSCGTNSNSKSYKLHYDIVQQLHDFCENNSMGLDYQEFSESVRMANFENILQKTKRKNCLKCMIVYIAKAIKGSEEEQKEWYEMTVRSIGLTKSASRKGYGNLPVGFDDSLKRIVDNFSFHK